VLFGTCGLMLMWMFRKWFTSYATQATNWTEYEVVDYDYGKGYTREGEWDFDVTRVVG
jgi:hypothetical protein